MRRNVTHCDARIAINVNETCSKRVEWGPIQSWSRPYGLISIGVPSSVMSHISTMSEFDTATQPSVQSQFS